MRCAGKQASSKLLLLSPVSGGLAGLIGAMLPLLPRDRVTMAITGLLEGGW